MNVKNAGYSIVEMLIVLAIVSILTSGAFFYLNAHQTLYKTDNQALLIADILQEARQRSLTQRRTMRVEIDLTDSVARLIDENTATTAADDKVLRELQLFFPNEVRMDAPSSEVTYNPPEPLPVPSAQYKISTYPLSTLHQVCTVRFQSTGIVVDAGDNDIGSNAVSKGITLHLWSPNQNNTRESSVARALTIIGSTGSVRLWEFNREIESGNKWIDSRRFGVYGGQGTGTSGS